MARSSEGMPREWLVRGSWPGGEFAADAPDTVAYAVEIAAALERAIEGVNKSALASHARVERTVLYRILEGRTWPDSLTIAKLEIALEADIWPEERPPRLRRASDPPPDA